MKITSIFTIILVVLTSCTSPENDSNSYEFNVRNIGNQNIKDTVSEKDPNTHDNITNISSNEYQGFLFGLPNRIEYPLRLGAFGNRLKGKKGPILINKEKTNFINEKLKIDIHIPPNPQTDAGFSDGYSYGYSILSKNVVSEVVGIGWNDTGLKDKVSYYTYLITHDTLGQIIDYRLLSYANNIDSLAYQEVNVINPKKYLIIKYDFIDYRIDNDYNPFNKSPIKVDLRRFLYKIDIVTGKIQLKKELDSKVFDCYSESLNFTGIFKRNKEVYKSEYWIDPASQ